VHAEPQGAFNDPRRELKRAQAHHVVTPSLDRLSRHRIFQDRMVMLLVERAANARVWVVEQ
jgi:hypothetical protein